MQTGNGTKMRENKIVIITIVPLTGIGLDTLELCMLPSLIYNACQLDLANILMLENVN